MKKNGIIIRLLLNLAVVFLGAFFLRLAHCVLNYYLAVEMPVAHYMLLVLSFTFYLFFVCIMVNDDVGLFSIFKRKKD